MHELKRLTTGYLEVEDRIRLARKIQGGATVVLWFTQRLMQRLLPVLLQSLEKQSIHAPYAEMLQGFAQQTARAGLQAESPVRDGIVWLVSSVDISKTEDILHLTFKGADNHQVVLVLATTPLRQWLGIVHDTYCKAGWSMAVWPQCILQLHVMPEELPAVLH